MSEKRRRGRFGKAGRGGLTMKRGRSRVHQLTIPNGFRRRLAKAGFAITRRRLKWFFESPEVWLIIPKTKRA